MASRFCRLFTKIWGLFELELCLEMTIMSESMNCLQKQCTLIVQQIVSQENTNCYNGYRHHLSITAFWWKCWEPECPKTHHHFNSQSTKTANNKNYVSRISKWYFVLIIQMKEDMQFRSRWGGFLWTVSFGSGERCRSRWGSSYWTTSSGFTLFSKSFSLFCFEI